MLAHYLSLDDLSEACECEDASWPRQQEGSVCAGLTSGLHRIDIGSPDRPCWQCVVAPAFFVESAAVLGAEVHPHVDMTLRSAGLRPGRFQIFFVAGWILVEATMFCRGMDETCFQVTAGDDGYELILGLP